MSVRLKVGEAEGHETGQRQLARYLSQHQGPPTEDEKCEGVIADVTLARKVEECGSPVSSRSNVAAPPLAGASIAKKPSERKS